MFSAEFKTLRESLGLSARAFADLVGVTHRTVQYWESGINQRGNKLLIPDTAIEAISALRRMKKEWVLTQLGLISKLGSTPVLLRYKTDEDLWQVEKTFKGLPCALHAIFVQAVVDAAELQGKVVRIKYMNVDDYLSWLGDKEHSLVSQAIWGAAQEA